ncbi:hypothetical protein [Pseudactinotalea sp.]|uniref:hypothetical protein n=1 Tax=Pseudactinotalea sp. TaxID=1926260 RepID=UPI003B3AED3D
MIIGVTGHRFYDEETAERLRSRVRDLLREWADDGAVRLVSSLAEGADQLVASIAVELGLPLEVVLPAEGYRESLDDGFEPEFDRLLAAAQRVTTLEHAEPGPAAYLDAGQRMLARSDMLLAVWDGEPARGTGGTAEIVAHARTQGIDVHVLWPDGARRQRA